MKKKRSFELGNKIQTCFVLPQLALLDWLILGAHFATRPGGAGHLLGTELGRPSIGHCWGAQSRAQIDQSTMLETEQNTDAIYLTATHTHPLKYCSLSKGLLILKKTMQSLVSF